MNQELHSMIEKIITSISKSLDGKDIEKDVTHIELNSKFNFGPGLVTFDVNGTIEMPKKEVSSDTQNI